MKLTHQSHWALVSRPTLSRPGKCDVPQTAKLHQPHGYSKQMNARAAHSAVRREVSGGSSRPSFINSRLHTFFRPVGTSPSPVPNPFAPALCEIPTSRSGHTKNPRLPRSFCTSLQLHRACTLSTCPAPVRRAPVRDRHPSTPDANVALVHALAPQHHAQLYSNL